MHAEKGGANFINMFPIFSYAISCLKSITCHLAEIHLSFACVLVLFFWPLWLAKYPDLSGFIYCLLRMDLSRDVKSLSVLLYKDRKLKYVLWPN
nr:hypothetical protein Itr_chr10CG19170 [Ipomoea trifida]